MPEVGRGERPLSPHLQIYRPQWTWVPSIMHRITGVGLAIGGVMVVWWFTAAAVGGRDYFVLVDGLITSWLGHVVLLGLTWSLAYHFLNGIRHLVWDVGFGFEIPTAERSAQGAVIGSAVLTVVFWLVTWIVA
jgi:succinate dehydrogenase / fumarate reductase cytochrome b subunit